MKTVTMKLLAQVAQSMITSSQSTIDQFAKNFATDPAYAFSWGDNAMDCAARRHAGNAVEGYITNLATHGKTGDEAALQIVKELSRKVLQAARFPEKSSSAVSNMMAVHVNAAFAEILSQFED